MILFAVLAQATSAASLGQAYHDDAAAQLAASVHGSFHAQGGSAIESHAEIPSASGGAGWRTITDDELRRRSGYGPPAGYRFRRAVSIDLNHDGSKDVVEMIERADQIALRITYGGHRRVVVANAHRGRWTDQGLFAAGTDAVMVNFPESGAYFLIEREGGLRIEYVGD